MKDCLENRIITFSVLLEILLCLLFASIVDVVDSFLRMPNCATKFRVKLDKFRMQVLEEKIWDLQGVFHKVRKVHCHGNMTDLSYTLERDLIYGKNLLNSILN